MFHMIFPYHGRDSEGSNEQRQYIIFKEIFAQLSPLDVNERVSDGQRRSVIFHISLHVS